jgi:hypothetical protein
MSRRARLTGLITPLCALLVVGIHLARGHGIGTPRLTNVASGPYLISAWTDPDPLRADQTHVVVGLTDPQTREPIITDVDIRVSLTSLADPSITVDEQAGHDSVNQLLFAAEFNDRLTPGRWRVGVLAGGSRGAGEEVYFDVDIAPARGFNWLWIGAGGMAALLVAWAFISLRPGPHGRESRPNQSAV